MSSISSVSNSSSAWASMGTTRTPPKDKLFSLVDSDSNGGIDTTELQTLMDNVAKKTGITNGSTAAELVTKLDSNGDGTLDAGELHQGITSIVQLPSTMEFAQTRTDGSGATGQAGDDLFSKVDTDGSGSLSSNEFTALMNKMAASGDANATSSDSSNAFASLDTDGDGTLTQAEFDAGRPAGANGPQGAGGPPPGGPPPASASSADSTTYDPLDTNKDGIVSAAGAATGTNSANTLQALLQAIDSDKDGKLSKTEADAFAKQVTTAVDTLQKSSTSTDSIDLNQLAQQVLKQYALIAAGQSSSSIGSTVSVSA